MSDVDFVHADMRALPVADDSVDVVVCALALTHVPQLRDAFAEFARVLRPGAARDDHQRHCKHAERHPPRGRRCGTRAQAPWVLSRKSRRRWDHS